MTTSDPVFDSVRAIVEKVAGRDRSPSAAGADTTLTEGYWLDSVEMLEVLVQCENAFGIVFDAKRDFDGSALTSLGSLTELVRSKLTTHRT